MLLLLNSVWRACVIKRTMKLDCFSATVWASSRAGLTIGQTVQMPGASRFWAPLEHQNTPLLVFHVFRLFTTRQNCRAFWQPLLVYSLRKLTTLAFIVFEWLKRIQPDSTTLYDPRIRSKSQCIHGRPRKVFPRGGQRRNFACPFQVADDAMQTDVHKTLYPFYPISLCWLNLNYQSFMWKCFLHFDYQKCFFFS